MGIKREIIFVQKNNLSCGVPTDVICNEGCKQAPLRNWDQLFLLDINSKTSEVNLDLQFRVLTYFLLSYSLPVERSVYLFP